MTQQTMFAAPPREPLKLRPYQEEALTSITDYFTQGNKRGLVALPTGGGKTVIFAETISRVRELVKSRAFNPRGLRALVLAHREELLDQAKASIEWAHPDLTVDIEQADRVARRDCDLVIASIPTLTSGDLKRLRALRPEDFCLIVVDEAHHATARTYVKVLAHFGLAPDPDLITALKSEEDYDFLSRQERREMLTKAYDAYEVSPEAPFLLGVTATPSRADGTGLEFIFDEIVYSKTIRELIEDGWLVPIRGFRVNTGVSIDKVATRGGDFADEALAKVIDTPERNAVAVQAYKDHAEGRQCIAFTSTVEHAKNLAAVFSDAGIKAEYVSGTTPKDQRRDIIARFKSKELTVVCNCGVLTEGFDAPDTGCIVMARPTKSSIVYTQAIGRGTRLAEGKNDLIVIDLVDAFSKAGVANLNTLFGLPPKFNSAGDDIVAVKSRMEEELETQVPFNSLANATDWDSAKRIAQEIDPLQAAALDPYIGNTATLAWVKTPWGYGLGLGSYDLGVVVDLLGHATLRKKASGMPAETLGEHKSAADAVKAAEAYVLERNPDARILVDRNAGWRKDAPSEKQLNMAKRLKIKVPEGATKGQVSALISVALTKQHHDEG